MLIALHKPYDMRSQFTPDHAGQPTLAACGFGAGVYPIGRLDRDSEGLLLLSDEAVWTDRLLNPRRSHPREYHVQVEGVPTLENLATLEQGVVIQGHRTQPAIARRLEPAPPWPPRTRIGQLELATLMLQPGQWRALDPQEIRAATA